MKSALFTLFPLAVVMLMSSCQPAVHMHVANYQEPLGPLENVIITKNATDIPAEAIQVGEVSVTDAGMTTKCSFEYVIEHARIKARESGGDIILITKHQTPDLWSSCHRIWGIVYRSPEGYDVAERREDIAGGQQPSSPEQNIQIPDSGDEQKEREGQPDETSTPADSRGSGINPGYFGEPQSQGSVRPSRTSPQNTQGSSAASDMHRVVLPERKEPSLMISGFGGFGRRLAPLPDGLNSDVENFMGEMKSGGVYGFDLSIRVAQSNYIGFYYSQFRSSGEIPAMISGANSTVTGMWEDNVSIDFIGFHWLTTFSHSKSGSFLYLSAMIGYTSFLNTGTGPFESETGDAAFLPFEFSGSTFGYRLEGGGHIALGDNIFLKLGLGLSTGVVTKIDVEIGNERATVEVDDPRDGEGLVRFDLLGGLVIAF